MNGSFGGGKGTKENPYLIDDLWDYLQMNSKISSANASLYFQLTKDIDMNNYEDYKFEIPDLCKISKAYECHLDGNNHSIKNIIVKDSGRPIFFNFETNYGELKNIKFENLILMNVSSGTGLFQSKNFKNVHIGCFIFDSDLRYLFPNTGQQGNTQDCSFNIKGKLVNGVSFWTTCAGQYDSLERVHINLDIFSDDYPGSNQGIILFGSYANLDNVYYTGKFKIKKINSYTGIKIFYSGYLKNSYCNIDIELPKSIINVNSISATSFSFANQDKIRHFDEDVSGITFSPSTNFSFLTDEQCRNPDTLLELGFPVVKSDS